jgi:hypothetical protein
MATEVPAGTAVGVTEAEVVQPFDVTCAASADWIRTTMTTIKASSTAARTA